MPSMLHIRYVFLFSHLVFALVICGLSSMIILGDLEYFDPGIGAITLGAVGALSALIYVLTVTILDGKGKPSSFDKLLGEVIYIVVSMLWSIGVLASSAYLLGGFCNKRRWSYCRNHPWSIAEICLTSIHLILLSVWLGSILSWVRSTHGGLRGHWKISTTALVRKEVLNKSDNVGLVRPN